MHVAFLAAGIPLTKRFWMQDGALQKSSYPLVSKFTSHTENIKTIEELAAQIQAHASLGHCMLKGSLHRTLKDESRAGSTRPDDATEWVCLDFDDAGSLTVSEALDAVGLNDVDYVVQYSSSHGITPGLRCHVFMLLAEPVSAPDLKVWLKKLNFDSEIFGPRIHLTASSVALKWPLDISTCQNDKLIYITPPELGPGVKRFKGPHVQLVKRKRRTIDVEPASERIVRSQETAKIKALRNEAGLAPHTGKSKTHRATAYLAEPGEVQITGIRTERGFVYFNFNGGDSWAYYHPEDDPTFIHNFKGEPVYLTRELLPGYWKEASKPKADATGKTYLAFSDLATGGYFRGYAEGEKLLLNPAKNAAQLKDYLKEHGQYVPDFIPTWSIVFDPHDTFTIDPDRRRVNTFERLPPPSGNGPRSLPKLAGRVLDNCVGSGEVQLRFLNWLAYIYQFQDRTSVAWLLHGIPGTGKGVLFNRYIRPTLRYVIEVNAQAFEEQFNAYLENKFLIAVDEAELREKQARSVMMKLKSYITEPYVAIRRHYSGVVEARNYSNFIFTSNRPDPLLIELDDRRFAVADYGGAKMEISQDEILSIEGELQGFYDYLMNYKVDRDAAQTPYVSSAKTRMQALSVNSVEIAIRRLAEGDFPWFVDQVVTQTVSDDTPASFQAQGLYIEQLIRIARHMRDHKDPMPMTREEIRILLLHCIDEIPKTPNKFTRMLHMHRFETKRITKDGENFYGAHIEWKATAEEVESFLRKHGPKQTLRAVRGSK